MYMAIFEKVSKYADADIAMPVRKTAQSAGYDMVAAEDYVIPSLWQMIPEVKELWPVADDEFVSMEMMAQFTKQTGFKPTLVSTGMKCKLDPGTWLQLSVRSSSPLKYWLMMGNSIGVIDADYYNNPDNEGEIFFQIYNLSPFNIQIKKGEAIGQAIILPYGVTEDDVAGGERTGGFGSTSK
jgi:dUTP pyrophosphatase